MGRKKASAVPPILTAAGAILRLPPYISCSSLSLRLSRSACVRFYLELMQLPALLCLPCSISSVLPAALGCFSPGRSIPPSHHRRFAVMCQTRDTPPVHAFDLLFCISIVCIYTTIKNKNQVFFCWISQYFFIFILYTNNPILVINSLQAPAKYVKLKLGLIRPGYTRAWACKDDRGKSASNLHVFCLQERKENLKWNKQKNSSFLKRTTMR